MIAVATWRAGRWMLLLNRNRYTGRPSQNSDGCALPVGDQVLLLLCSNGPWKAGQAYQRNPIDWYLVDSMHDHHMAECMQSYVCLVLISVRDKVMVAGYFTLETSLLICNTT